MGAVVVKDATGTELHRAFPAIAGERLTLTVPHAVLTRAQYPLTIDPTVGPERSTGDPVYAAAPDTQTAPAVAWNGTDYLVVWEDLRSGNRDIYGSRLSGAGSVLDPAGIPISTGGQHETVPQLDVRYDFLVAWRDLRFGTGYAIFATRVSPAGVVREPGGIGLTGAGTKTGVLAVTGGPGDTWGVAYERYAAESPYGANRVFLRSVSPK